MTNNKILSRDEFHKRLCNMVISLGKNCTNNVTILSAMDTVDQLHESHLALISENKQLKDTIKELESKLLK